jgi:hypothetical protein
MRQAEESISCVPPCVILLVNHLLWFGSDGSGSVDVVVYVVQISLGCYFGNRCQAQQ